MDRITEDMQIQCLARFGCVFNVPKGSGRDYWTEVWDWLRVQHRDLCHEPDKDYPMHTGKDIDLLNEFFEWQNERRKI